jgi:hypothetical protein
LESVEFIAGPAFSTSPKVAIHQAAAGDYYGIVDILEYITLVIVSLNEGYVWLGPPMIDPASIKYFPQNATIFSTVGSHYVRFLTFFQNLHYVAFGCSRLPVVDPVTGKLVDPGDCDTPPVLGSSGGMFTFESCGTKIIQYISNFEDFTNKGAVQQSNPWDTCWRAMAYCQGPNTIFGGSFDACYNYMKQIPTVSCLKGVLKGHSSVCRGLHAFLARFRPEVHCPHITPESATCLDSHCDGGYACPETLPMGPADYRWGPVKSQKCVAKTSCDSCCVDPPPCEYEVVDDTPPPEVPENRSPRYSRMVVFTKDEGTPVNNLADLVDPGRTKAIEVGYVDQDFAEMETRAQDYLLSQFGLDFSTAIPGTGQLAGSVVISNAALFPYGTSQAAGALFRVAYDSRYPWRGDGTW